jgi:hypothetical protein
MHARFKRNSPKEEGTDRSNLLNTTTLTNNNDYSSSHLLITNRDGNFGVGFNQMKKKYFKEYDVELIGKDSPGPANYSPNVSIFKLQKHDAKTFALVRILQNEIFID